MRPSKSYFYKMLYNDISHELKKNKDLYFIDFACGHGQLLHDLKFKNYIGVDIDKNEIISLKTIFPEKKFYYEDILFFKSPIKADIACCVETFGFNVLFKKIKLIDTLKNISNNLNESGTFFFNIHKELFEKNFNDINIFFKKFETIDIKKYGFFTQEYSQLNHKIVYQLEKFVSDNFENGKYLYVKCINYSSNFSIK